MGFDEVGSTLEDVADERQRDSYWPGPSDLPVLEGADGGDAEELGGLGLGEAAAVAPVLQLPGELVFVLLRNALAHAGKSGRRVVSAFVATAFAQEDPASASRQWRTVADQLRPKLPKLATLMDDAEADVLAYMGFPAQHRAKLHSTNPLERLNGEIKRRTDVVGIFPNEAAITRLVGAILLEQNDEWAVQRARYMTLETMAPVSDNALVSLPAVPA